MKKLLLFGCLVTGLTATSQTTLFQDDLESGSGNWTITGTGDNSWRYDNVYAGDPFGFIAATPDQPGGITGGPQSTYMHITSGAGCTGLGACNANFDTGSTSDRSSEMNTGVVTTAMNTTTISFWYLCGGAAGASFGTLEYNANNAGWVNAATYSGVSTWTQENLTMAAWNNVADLRFRFRWQNGGAGTDPAFSVDEVLITAIAAGGNSITTTNDVTPVSWCQSSDQALTVNFVATGTFNGGNVYTAEMSDAVGSFAAATSIGSLTSSSNGSLTINATVPGSMAVGTGYRVRVVASNPSTTGSDNSSDLAINALPTVTQTPFSQVCVYEPMFTITGGSPASGTYSGTGITANVFDPAAAGNGTHTITYTFTDANGCMGSASESIVVDACLGINETNSTLVSIYPNPTNATFSIASELNIESVNLVDMSGRTILSFENNTSTYDVSNVPSGVYMVQITLENETVVERLTIK